MQAGAWMSQRYGSSFLNPNLGRHARTADKTRQWRQSRAIFLFCLATAIALPAQTFNSLVSFDVSNGGQPEVMSLVQGLDGNFYGTTSCGGAHIGCLSNPGGGTVFRIARDGTLTTLYSFCAQTNCTDGSVPTVGLTLGTDGNFYGTTMLGGVVGVDCTGTGKNGCGTVFKITPGGTLATLYRFCSKTNCADGGNPYAPLIQATDGNFYGVTGGGGNTKNCAGQGCGTVFKVTPDGTFTTLYSFCVQAGCPDGTAPKGGLIQATDGDLYGTTLFGGKFGWGTAFKITTTGTLTTIHTFDFARYPNGGLVQTANGNFFGTTGIGGYGTDCGDQNGCGTVFRITPSGATAVLYGFCKQNNCSDGARPGAPLVQGTDGNFYGTDPEGGTNNDAFCSRFLPPGCGTVFKVTASGTLTTLHAFDGTDGFSSLEGLVQGTDGSFYGATTYGGTSTNCEFGCGTVFTLSVGLGPFVRTVPTAAKVGTAVRILGTDLSGATGVKFNATAAMFTVASKSQIKTTVPTGATTGTVTVTTPSGTLNSNVTFRVLP